MPGWMDRRKEIFAKKNQYFYSFILPIIFFLIGTLKKNTSKRKKIANIDRK